MSARQTDSQSKRLSTIQRTHGNYESPHYKNKTTRQNKKIMFKDKIGFEQNSNSDMQDSGATVGYVNP
uniref:Uncharacterized protein n=1 Tax=Arundo donax TaxID=35708 RepID=A0A0A9B9V8_ARUDO